MVLPQKTENAGFLNPTLAVQAFFTVPIEGDIGRRTQFKLLEHHDVARWLLTFLEYLLWKRGELEGERRIAEPPGGHTREELIRGEVILVSQRPDGGQAMRLNPKLEMGLYLYARRPGQPALDTAIAIGEDPELTVWLLAYCLGGGKIPSQVPLTDSLIQSLRRHSIFVDALPAPEVYFPDPAAPVDLAAELAPMSRVFHQPAGEPIPPEVREVLGKETPRLPPDTDIAWGQDGGTGMVFPIRLPPGTGDISALVGTQAAAERAAQWERRIQLARDTMREGRYAVLPEILPAAQREKLRHYVRQLRANGYFPELGVGDVQVTLRTNIHKEQTIASLHNGLARLVNRFDNQLLIPSFCQLGIYEEGAVLDRHLDRSQCERNMSFVFDMTGPDGEPEPWPFYIEVNGAPKQVMLKPGDGAVYAGHTTPHWRDALPAGQSATAAFFFFVPPDFKGTFN
ncbi:MAG: hypothetical protein L6Q83_00805 [Gammaproteobacteria bacterium]|nr:hypothetical protein [Gammaproteobacteria bacterium]